MEAVSFPTREVSCMDETEFACPSVTYSFQRDTIQLKDNEQGQNQTAEVCPVVFSVVHFGLKIPDFSSWGSAVLLSFSGFQFPHP